MRQQKMRPSRPKQTGASKQADDNKFQRALSSRVYAKSDVHRRPCETDSMRNRIECAVIIAAGVTMMYGAVVLESLKWA